MTTTITMNINIEFLGVDCIGASIHKPQEVELSPICGIFTEPPAMLDLSWQKSLLFIVVESAGCMAVAVAVAWRLHGRCCCRCCGWGCGSEF